MGRECDTAALKMRHLAIQGASSTLSVPGTAELYCSAGGLIGGMMGYKIMWLQLLGFSGWAVGLISTCVVLGAAIGFIVGGCLGDMMHLRYPNAARPFINQLSMLLSAPLAIMLYKGMPGAPRSHWRPGICLFVLSCESVA